MLTDSLETGIAHCRQQARMGQGSVACRGSLKSPSRPEDPVISQSPDEKLTEPNDNLDNLKPCPIELSYTILASQGLCT